MRERGSSESPEFSAIFYMYKSNLGKDPAAFIRFSKDFQDLEMVKNPCPK